MKTITRTLIILLTAGLISLGWYAYATTNSTQTSMPDQPAEFAAADDAANTEAANAGTDVADQVPPSRPDGGEQSFSVSRVLSGVAIIIGQTVIVIALVVLVRKLGNWLRTSYFRKSETHGKLNAPPQPN